MVETCESNENGQFSALVRLISGCEIDNVVFFFFFATTKIFGEKQTIFIAFLLLLRLTYMQKLGKFYFSSLTELFMFYVGTERTYITGLRRSACQPQIPTDHRCSHLVGLLTLV